MTTLWNTYINQTNRTGTSTTTTTFHDHPGRLPTPECPPNLTTQAYLPPGQSVATWKFYYYTHLPLEPLEPWEQPPDPGS
ncbi:hypothetical protein N7495_002110 [Penicillium taxi]|uniref:uncharacterized protein n=1 Tax=Penicillium taxi TaxID=168475 RepID=UPI00254516E7|nr:uncharacterized protein N7495_002110 [Penicillium taxi]KAJ5901582.1 hypothetical protein N7495_002110 [Penicillium taxi]